MQLRTPVLSPYDPDYPDSDGQPMADSTLQYQWIVMLVSGLRALFQNRDDVFVAGDLLWYPVQGHREICAAPDAMVAFGRPKGHRRSYKQWEEGGLAPQVAFEVRSHKNTETDMARKREFYERYGVQEYYDYDPDEKELKVWLRNGDRFEPVPNPDGFVSPLLGISFELRSGEDMVVYKPDGTFMRDPVDALARLDVAEAQNVDLLEENADLEETVEVERRARQQAEAKLRDLEEQLRRLGGQQGTP